MIWKSNLNPIEREVIDDFGGKITNLAAEQSQKAKPTVARPQTAQVSGKKSQPASASKPQQENVAAPEMIIKAPKSVVAEHYAPAQNESRDPGAGEALAHTLEKIVTQIEII
jgi:hypothetical protein